MKEFKREYRYLVLKFKDINKYLSAEDKAEILRIAHKIAKGRCDDRRMPIECVVVERDWPEYEPTWAAIESRMTGRTICKCGAISPEINSSVEAKLDDGYDCPHATTRPPNPPTPSNWKPRGPWEPQEPGRQCG